MAGALVQTRITWEIGQFNLLPTPLRLLLLRLFLFPSSTDESARLPRCWKLKQIRFFFSQNQSWHFDSFLLLPIEIYASSVTPAKIHVSPPLETKGCLNLLFKKDSFVSLWFFSKEKIGGGVCIPQKQKKKRISSFSQAPRDDVRARHLSAQRADMIEKNKIKLLGAEKKKKKRGPPPGL